MARTVKTQTDTRQCINRLDDDGRAPKIGQQPQTSKTGRSDGAAILKRLSNHFWLLAILVTGALVAIWTNVAIFGHPFAFGSDALAYLHAAERLTQTGSPYAPGQLNSQSLVFINDAYLYPPTLAWLLVPFVALAGSGTPALLTWSAASLVAFAASLCLGLGAAKGSLRSARSLAIVIAVGLWTASSIGWPQGNVSVFLGLLVACALFCGPGARAGAALMAAAIIKVTPIMALPAAMAAGGRRALAGAIVSGLVLIGIPFLLNPASWFDGARVVLNLNAGSAAFPLNLAPAAWLAWHLPGLATFAPIVRLLSLLAAAACMVGSVLVARDRTRDSWPAALALGVAAWLLLGPQLWFHYLVVLAPFEVYAIMWGDVWSRRAAWTAVFLTPLALLGPPAWVIIALVVFALIRSRE